MSETANATATADTAAQTGTEGQTDATATATDATDAATEAWYTKYKPADEDAKILGRYKGEAEAIKSIGHRERAFHNRLEMPKADAKPDDVVKSHRDILGKLGAPKEAAGYRTVGEAAWEKVSPELRERLGDKWMESCYEDAAEANLLPWQFERALSRAIKAQESGMGSVEDAKLARQDKLERALKSRFGLQWGTHATNAELVGKHMDDFLAENAKGLEVGPDGKPIKDAFTQRLKAYNDPYLYAAFDHLFDILLSEGEGGPRRLGGKADDAYTTHFNWAKENWPQSPPEDWARYAREKASSLGGAA